MKVKSIFLLFVSMCSLVGILSSCANQGNPEADAQFHFGPGPDAEEQESTDVRA